MFLNPFYEFTLVPLTSKSKICCFQRPKTLIQIRFPTSNILILFLSPDTQTLLVSIYEFSLVILITFL